MAVRDVDEMTLVQPTSWLVCSPNSLKTRAKVTTRWVDQPSRKCQFGRSSAFILLACGRLTKASAFHLLFGPSVSVCR